MRAELFCYNVPRPILAAAAFFLLVCVTQCSWFFFSLIWDKITFVLKQTEKESVKKTKLGDHNCITIFFYFFKALFFDNTN